MRDLQKVNMDKTQIITLVLGSAAIGALVSSVITLAGQYFERKARREELLLTKAVEMAHYRYTIATDYAKTHGGGVVPEIEIAADFHRYLRHLLTHNDLPKNYARYDEYIKAQKGE